MTADRSARPGGGDGLGPFTISREIRIRIFVYPRDGRWYAESIELKLLGEGTDPNQALSSLLDSIKAFAETALARGWLEAFDRKQPVWRRLQLQSRVLRSRLRLKPARTITRAFLY